MLSERDSPVAIETPYRTNPLGVLHELLFSIFLPFLILSAHEQEAGGRWAIALVRWGVLHNYLRPNVGIEDNRLLLMDFLLLWLSAALIFLILRVFARLPITRLALRSFAGLVAIAGFPLAAMYVRSNRILSPEVALLLGGMGLVLFLWANRKWPASTPLNVFLLFLYFAVWATPLAGGTSLKGAAWILLWPGWDRLALRIWQYGWLIYPILGFCSTLLWAAFFRRTENTGQRAQASF